MKKIMFAVLGASFLVGCFLFGRNKLVCRRKDVETGNLPSGKKLPKDEELVYFSQEQLEGFSHEDLTWLEDYALFMRSGASDETAATKWDDFLRRIDIAMNRF